jgi:hypothetical protein
MTAIDMGFVTPEQVLDCLTAQIKADKILKKHNKIGEIMVMRGLINQKQYGDILDRLEIFHEELKEEMPLFGEILISKGFATPEAILACLNIQEMEDSSGMPHRYIAEIMLAEGIITQEQFMKAISYKS